MNDAGDGITFTPVMNAEEELYSIWPVNRAIPPGWTAVGKPGTKEECLAWVREEWKKKIPGGLRPGMVVQLLQDEASF